jgi:Kdo2-lipid IVA lauroyltransferase/acyltransferase
VSAYWVYLIATSLAPMLPEKVGYWLFAIFGQVAYVFGQGARTNYLNNLKHVVGPNVPESERKRIARQAFRNSFKNYFDLFRGHRLSEQQIRSQISQVIGFEHLESALAQGKGIVAGTAHFGNFNLFLHLAAVYLKGYCHVIVPNERLRPERLFELVKRQRAAQGIEIVPVDTAVRQMIRALHAGSMVGLALDFDITNTGTVVDFFGSPARLPDGGVALSLKYGAPLVIGFTRRLADNRCTVVIEPPVQLEKTNDLATDVQIGMQKLARRLEEWIRRYPDQWMMFQPIWEEDQNK